MCIKSQDIIQQIFDFLQKRSHNTPANPKDCHQQQPCVRYAQGTSTGEFSLLMLVFVCNSLD